MSSIEARIRAAMMGPAGDRKWDWEFELEVRVNAWSEGLARAAAQRACESLGHGEAPRRPAEPDRQQEAFRLREKIFTEIVAERIREAQSESGSPESEKAPRGYRAKVIIVERELSNRREGETSFGLARIELIEVDLIAEPDAWGSSEEELPKLRAAAQRRALAEHTAGSGAARAARRLI